MQMGVGRHGRHSQSARSLVGLVAVFVAASGLLSAGFVATGAARHGQRPSHASSHTYGSWADAAAASGGPEASGHAEEPWHAGAVRVLKGLASGLALCAVLLGGMPRLTWQQAAPGAAGGLSLASVPEPAYARGLYSSGSKVNKDPVSLLQLALPLEETLGEKKVESVRTLQTTIEQVRANSLLRLWDKAAGNADDSARLLKQQRKTILSLASASRQAQVEAVLAKLDEKVIAMQAAIAQGQTTFAATVKDAEAVSSANERTRECQELMGQLEMLLVPPGYVAPVPTTSDIPKDVPRLNGRATVELVLKRPEGSGEKKYGIDADLYEEAKLKMVVDGWSTPLTAGNFVDLVDKGYYSNKSLQRADGFIIQFGDSGKENGNGYMVNGKVRTVPLEVAIKGEKGAIYGETLDEARKVGQQVKIPFQTDGTIAMARKEFDNDSGSAQIFMFLFEADMTPAGKNLLDGRYSSFGYIVEGTEFLRQLKESDMIVSAKVLDGMDNLVRP